jgi:hypothetical protein
MKYILLAFILILPLIATGQPKPGKKGKKENKKVNYAFMPVIMYNRSFGGQFGVMANAYFDINQKDTISPASSVAFIGNIFTNKTFFTGIFSRFYFGEDGWRLKVGTGLGDIRFQTFNELPPDLPSVLTQDENGEFIDYKTRMFFFFAEGTRKVVKNFYLGARTVYSSNYTEFDSDTIPDEDVNLYGFGAASEFDNRDNVFYPMHGLNTRIRTLSFLKALGSSTTYHRINMDFNKYFNLGKKAVILGRFYGMISVGDSVPFSGKNVVGRDDLRGYTDGKHRANMVYDLQTEYRWNFYKKWGMVAFTGIALATDDFKGTNYSGILPMAGAGIRFRAIPKRRINIGLDAAIGKDDWGVYFRIGETFTK